MTNLTTSKGETLAKTTAGYDEALKNENLRNLVDMITHATTE